MSQKFRIREDSKNRLVYRRVEDLPTRAHQVFRAGFFDFMAALKVEANKEILRKPKAGRTYIARDRSGRKRRHKASAPGESHANLSGTLRRSLSWKVFGWEKAEFGYGVSSNAQNKAPGYAGFVELGTRLMKPRPSLQNAVRATERDVHFDRALDKMIQGFK